MQLKKHTASMTYKFCLLLKIQLGSVPFNMLLVRYLEEKRKVDIKQINEKLKI